MILEGTDISQKKYKNLEELMGQVQNGNKGEKKTNSISSKSQTMVHFSLSEDFKMCMNGLQSKVHDTEEVLKIWEDAKSKFSYYDPENPKKSKKVK